MGCKITIHILVHTLLNIYTHAHKEREVLKMVKNEIFNVLPSCCIDFSGLNGIWGLIWRKIKSVEYLGIIEYYIQTKNAEYGF